MENIVWVLGDVVIDFVFEDLNSYFKCSGGVFVNVVVGIVRLGGKSVFIGWVG